MSGPKAQDKVHTCLTALQFVEEGLLELSLFEKLNTTQMMAVVDEARNTRKARTSAKLAEREAQNQAKQEAVDEREITAKSSFEAKEANKARMRAAKAREHAELEAIEKRAKAREETTAVARHLSKGMQGGEIATKKASQEAYKVRSKPEEVPPRIEDALRKVLKKIGSYLDGDRDEVTAQLAEIIAYKQHLRSWTRKDAAATLNALAKRAQALAEQFENEPVKRLK